MTVTSSIPDPTQPVATPAAASTSTTSSSTSSSTAKISAIKTPHVLLAGIVLIPLAAIAVLTGLHDQVPAILEAIPLAALGALGVAIPTGTSSV